MISKCQLRAPSRSGGSRNGNRFDYITLKNVSMDGAAAYVWGPENGDESGDNFCILARYVKPEDEASMHNEATTFSFL